MPQASRSKQQKRASSPASSPLGRGVRESALLIFSAIALYMLLALVSYSPTDPAWSHSTSLADTAKPSNLGGRFGAWFSDITLYLLGYMAYLFPILVGYAGWLVYRFSGQGAEPSGKLHPGLRGFGFVLTLASGSGLSVMHFQHPLLNFPLHAGGVLGDVVSQALIQAFNPLGATLLLLTLFLTGVTFFTGLSWFWLMDSTGAITLNGLKGVADKWYQWRDRLAAKRAERQARAAEQKQEKLAKKAQTAKKEPRISVTAESASKPAEEPGKKKFSIKPPAKPIEVSERVEKEKQGKLFKHDQLDGLPGLSLLDKAKPSQNPITQEELEAAGTLLEEKLADFGITAEVESIHQGPVITRFEIHLAPGTKASQVTNLSKDLARALLVASVRVVEVIPGKSTVGLEIPNKHREMIFLSEVLSSKQFNDSGAKLPLALGKDISGEPSVADLAKMPHLLVAGTTGSGKSVGVNAMILSLLYRLNPDELRLIMVDPKMLELSIYEGIPHLLAPVVTDMKEAANALRWCVAEMERRYKLMAAMGVRNVAGFNKKVNDAIDAGEPLTDPLFEPNPLNPEETAPELEPLPYIVIIIDEFADMMMIVGKKVEELIARLAQKARAAGLHLVLATQRPSVDVITGLIKANVPTRVAFQVSSKIDSRTILDQMGAEHLLGNGDMLYLAPGTGVPDRVHGAFVSDNEVHRVVDDLKSRGQAEYIDEILSGEGVSPVPGVPGEAGGDDESDPLYDEAIKIVTETRRASISSIQRRLKVGYNRAARMVEDMERAGVVSEVQSNGMREVLAPPPPKD